jgi:threonine/homoserine/homoserine lactone efflux protein
VATEISKPEIDNHIMKLIVGVIALTLAWLTSYFSSGPLASISESYYEEGWSRDIFVGFLFAISAFLVAYNGLDWPEEMVLAKIAAVAALFVAMFPCDCGRNNEIIPYVHFISAAVMFLSLAMFCWIFYRRALTKPYREARGRAAIYLVCGAVIVLAVVVLAYDGLTGNSVSAKVERLIFYGEAAGLIAFGVSWLVASRVFPVITDPEERVHVLPKRPH